MTLQERLDELRRRHELAQAGGGAERVARQHADGKLSARERLDQIHNLAGGDAPATVDVQPPKALDFFRVLPTPSRQTRQKRGASKRPCVIRRQERPQAR